MYLCALISTLVDIPDFIIQCFLNFFRIELRFSAGVHFVVFVTLFWKSSLSGCVHFLCNYVLKLLLLQTWLLNGIAFKVCSKNSFNLNKHHPIKFRAFYYSLKMTLYTVAAHWHSIVFGLFMASTGVSCEHHLMVVSRKSAFCGSNLQLFAFFPLFTDLLFKKTKESA